ncbi:MAG: TonB-dependent receptor [Bacteroidaceae bacterium]|nr:TonB-dependent receptor [Bacteroidaceae bacterium]
MSNNFRKTAFVIGLCAALGLCGAPKTFAAESAATAQPEQQAKKVSGTVFDAQGEVIGATVMEKGTSNGTVTDFNGNFSLNVKPGATLVISYIGYVTQEVKVGNQSSIQVTLKEDSKNLDELVVVGYGVQKKKLVTGATVQVKGDELTKLSTTSAFTALQSQTPGVMIMQSSGQAGESFKVNIRGIGTTGNSDPLYVIDGVAGGDLNNLNPSDIESIDVLKDAASAAIYGARAANGVILITTKQGNAGKLQISYDGYVGKQYLYKSPDALNAQEYIYSRQLRAFNGGADVPDWQSKLPAGIYGQLFDENGNVRPNGWSGTDWIDESYHKGAVTQNHAINLTGGNELSKFSFGFAYVDQDGILGGENQSQFERYNVRLNSTHSLLRSKDNKYDVIKIGENVNINRGSRRGISQSNMYWNNVHDLYNANPLLPARDADGNYYTNAEMAADGWTLGSGVNPLALAATTSQGLNESNYWNVNTSAFLEIQPIKNLIFKSQFGYRFGNSSYHTMTRVHASGTNVATQDNAGQQMNQWSHISWENTLTYSFDLNKVHHFNAVIGQSIEQNGYGENLSVTGSNLLFGDSWNHAYVTNAQIQKLADVTVSGAPAKDSSLASFFGRVSYNFDEKYMVQATLRADGSSNFARGHRWGYFPSASVGWVLTNEKFMEPVTNVMDFFKLRASWGQNGNCNIDNFNYLTQVSFNGSEAYYFGVGNHETATTGGSFSVLGNPDLTWETSEQLNIGFDARFFNSRLGLAFDWYKKTTKDWLVRAPILGVYGIGAPYVNGGDVENKGVEIAINWNDQLENGLRYGASFNMAYNKNEVTKIANGEGIIHGPGAVWHQLEGEIYRAQVGEPIGFFYGFATNGVFQNGEQIAEFSEKYQDKLHGGNDKLRPGDLIYVDTNGDGFIDDNDRTNIGDPHPDVTMGANINLAYKGFDFSITGNGAFGQQILRTWANQDFLQENLNKKIVYGSWKGEGTSNKLPIFDSFDAVNWKYMSQAMLESGNYFKIQNVTLGYDFKNIWKSCPLSQLRLYVAVNNLYTFTNYSGMDPEVGMNGGTADTWAAGIDTGIYPSPRTYLIGVNIKF